MADHVLKDMNLVSVCLRIFLAMLCGGVIGAERGRSNQPAGMRTYMLVCMGSAVVMMTGQFMYNEFQSGDPARLGAQVVSGIGFLGAGSIIISGKTRVRGLTTAAGLWAAACIGLSIGIGFYECGIAATIAVFLIITHFRKIENLFTFNDTWLSVYVEMDEMSRLSDFYSAAAGLGMKVGDIQLNKKNKEFQSAIVSLRNQERKSRDQILGSLAAIEGVQFVKYTS